MDLKSKRIDYIFDGLDEDRCPEKPMELFREWFDDWMLAKPDYEVGTEFVLSTADASSRVLLMKEFDESGFKFFTSYDSDKSKSIASTHRAGMLFFWSKLARQVRISVELSQLSRSENIEYFESRPRGSQISAIISHQSHIITREELASKRDELERSEVLECPQSWGGYLAKPFRYEFWQGKADRLHDRIVYESGRKFRISP